MTNNHFSREELLSIIETDHLQYGEASMLARMALAAMDSEPVAITDSMAYAFHHALTDGPLGDDEVEEIKSGLRAAFASVTATQPAPERAHKWSYGLVHPENCQCIECRSARINGVTP
ncbi:hypothetical protein [Klebsiella pneumoniae]|uniref:hypothetical protein n=1 Tax=Klebsiella pneumoniae TaxID=573 RepID=UPI000E2CC151|nr:Uncharacterised protein [Klebsiella pneumoniae]